MAYNTWDEANYIFFVPDKMLSVVIVFISPWFMPLMFLLAGASRENIVKNYAISYEYLKDFLAPSIAKLPDNMKHILKSDAHNMETFLDYIDSKWNGDVANLLITNGLTESEITALKTKIIAD